MNRLIGLLGGVLGVQLILASFLGWTSTGISGVARNEQVLSFDTKAITRVTLEQPQKAALVLDRQGNGWSIPALEGFPAFTGKVDGILGRLSGLYKRTPVATSAVALKRFKVSPTNFEHKVTLAVGEKTVATLWLGDSPGVRQIYGRANDEEAVYSLDITAYEVDADPNQWADKTLLTLKPEEIAEITLLDAHLVREKAPSKEAKKDSKDSVPPGKWQLEGLQPGEEINAEAIDTLVNRLSGIGFEAVLGKENKPVYRQDAPVLKLSVRTQAGELREYVFSEQATDSTASGKGMVHVLKTSVSPYYLKVADFTVAELMEMHRNKLLKQPATPPVGAAPTTPAPTVPAATPPVAIAPAAPAAKTPEAPPSPEPTPAAPAAKTPEAATTPAATAPAVTTPAPQEATPASTAPSAQ